MWRNLIPTSGLAGLGLRILHIYYVEVSNILFLPLSFPISVFIHCEQKKRKKILGDQKNCTLSRMVVHPCIHSNIWYVRGWRESAKNSGCSKDQQTHERIDHLGGQSYVLEPRLSQFVLVLRKIMKAPIWWGFLNTVIILGHVWWWKMSKF